MRWHRWKKGGNELVRAVHVVFSFWGGRAGGKGGKVGFGGDSTVQVQRRRSRRNGGK